MTGRTRIYLGIIALLIVLVAVLDSGIPKKTDWTEQYRTDGKAPFDLEIFFKEYTGMTSWTSVHTPDSTLYQFAHATYGDSVPDGNLYVFIGNAFDMDKESEKVLLSHVEQGSDAFISLNAFMGDALDTLGLDLRREHFYTATTLYAKLNGVNDSLTIDRLLNASYFYAYKRTEPYVSLGHYLLKEHSYKYPNLIKIPYGKGTIYLHSTPAVFSNYYLLNGSQDMAERLMSLSGKRHLVFTASHSIQGAGQSSPHLLAFIFSHPALKWAWYTALGSLFIFIFFNAKRKQRVVPVLPPLENSTVAFAQTISNLFYETGDHAYIIRKRITYFLEHIRTRYHLDTSDLNIRFTEQLSVKSGVSYPVTDILIKEILHLNNQPGISETQVVHLDRLLEQFKKEEQSFIQNNDTYGTQFK